MRSLIRYELARLRHRLGCARCASGTHRYSPLPEDPDHHFWIPPGLRKKRPGR